MASVKKQPNGRYLVRYWTDDGQQRKRRFDHMKEAKEFASAVETDKARGVFVDPREGRIKFHEYADRVFASRLNLRPATRSRDESYLRNHVIPEFQNKAIARVSRKDVQAWVKSLVEKGLAPRTVRECYRIFGGIMREAVDERLIRESPCRRISLPRIENVERRFLTAPQLETLADSIDERYATLVYVAGYCGLRWGELSGLKRRHVDMLRARISVVGSLERVGSGWRYVEETKTTSGRRMIPLPKFLVEALAAHLANAPDSEWTFPAPEGGHLRYHSWRQRFWQPAVDDAGVRPLTVHELRHTAAALWIDNGANPITVQRRMGHKDVRTTLQLYGHRFPEQDEALTARLEELHMEARVTKACPDEVVKLSRSRLLGF
jgi:integrase